MNIGELSYNWFDLVVLGLIGLGVYRGRTRGMSEELLDLMKWLVIVVVAAMAYRPLGTMLAAYTYLPKVTSFVAIYLGVLITVRFLFGWMKRLVGEKLVGGDVFGRGEYYLGMAAGAVRFACYTLVGMALLNAVYVSPEQLAANVRVQKENFGDISFPTLGSLQQTVFAGSASGKAVKRYLSHELIVPIPSDVNSDRGETLGRRSERAIDEVLGVKK